MGPRLRGDDNREFCENSEENKRRTNPLLARYQGREVETEVAMPMMYLPWIIFSAMTSMLLDPQRSDRK